jgi:hypothetical protein
MNEATGFASGEIDATPPKPPTENEQSIAEDKDVSEMMRRCNIQHILTFI